MNTVTDTPSQPDRHVLVVEDHVIAQVVTTAFLSELQCKVDIAASGQAALQLCQTQQYDLIFMDIGLPDMQGYEVTQHIRKNESYKAATTPIIALTAHVGEEGRQRCLEAGMNAIFTKPLTRLQCKTILESYINASTN